MKIAVIIPVRDDHEGLASTLESVAAVERADHTVEVIVSVDGPDARAAAVAEAAGAAVVTSSRPAGSYAARNAAIDQLPDCIELVMFTDAGCVVRSKWLLAHVDSLEDAALSGGAVVRVHPRRLSPAAYVDRERNLTQKTYVEKDGFAATANLAVHRKVLDEVRFDPSLESGGDRDFCRRATARGHALVYAADAEVEHDCRATLAAVTAKARRVARGVAALPAISRPARLPEPRLGIGLARRALRTGVSRNPVWLLRVAWADCARTAAFVAEARRAGYVPPVRDLDVVIMSATRAGDLAQVATRTHHLVRELRVHPAVAQVRLVDFPRARRRLLLARLDRTASPAEAFPALGVDVIDAAVGIDPARPRLCGIAFRRTAKAIDRRLGQPSGPRLIIAASPLWAPVATHLDAQWRIFDVVDDQRALPSLASRRRWIDIGYATATRFDAVAANTPGLATWINGTYVPNGVDVERFRSASPAPPAQAGGRPYAVYVGVIQERFDLELVAEVGRRLEGRSCVVIAGPADPATGARLAQLPGVVHLGPVPPAAVPGLLRGARVGLVPHRVDTQTKAMDPLKVLEYLAAGLPVVSTPVRLPDLAMHAVFVEQEREAFADRVVALIENPTAPPHTALADRPWRTVADELLRAATGGT